MCVWGGVGGGDRCWPARRADRGIGCKESRCMFFCSLPVLGAGACGRGRQGGSEGNSYSSTSVLNLPACIMRLGRPAPWRLGAVLPTRHPVPPGPGDAGYPHPPCPLKALPLPPAMHRQAWRFWTVQTHTASHATTSGTCTASWSAWGCWPGSRCYAVLGRACGEQLHCLELCLAMAVLAADAACL